MSCKGSCVGVLELSHAVDTLSGACWRPNCMYQQMEDQ